VLDRNAYLSASPWNHLVVDGAFEPDLVASAGSYIADLPDEAFVWHRTRRLCRGTLSDQESLGPAVRSICSALVSREFVEDLGNLTQIAGLAPDSGMTSADVYVIPTSGWQSVHQDPPRHPITGLWGRVAVLLYVSDWEPGDGGELELWPEDRASPPTTIEPRPGRMVVFAPTTQTLHAVRTALSGRRVTLSLRYYSAEKPAVLPSFYNRCRFGMYSRAFRYSARTNTLRHRYSRSGSG
jgi:2OG-Fe(II) oxygenase superfamily